MRPYRSVWVVLLLLALDGPARAEEPVVRSASPRSIVARRALDCAYRVQVTSRDEVRRSASAVGVAQRTVKGRTVTWLLTNAHVADPAGLPAARHSIVVERRGAPAVSLPARLVRLGRVPELDLALLEVEGAWPVARLAEESALQPGDEVVAVGAPYGKALSVSGGILSQLEEESGCLRRLKTDAPIGYGSSGGGLFSVPDGLLIGLVEGYRTARVSLSAEASIDLPMPGETFAAPVGLLRQFVAEAERAEPLPR